MTSLVTKDQVNEVMCGPLKRKGRFCSRCTSGYGIAVFSKTTVECVCCDNKYAWPLYLALVLLPITLFYFLVILFNFSATQPPVTAYTFYCQLFVQVNIYGIRHHLETDAYKTLTDLTWTVSEIWNLDMFRYVVPGFCLDERLTNIDAILLELVAALYPLPLIFLTFILIEMHASNIRVVVYLWKPFHRCFTSVRRAWDPRSSVTNAFATFLLLSSFKVCFIIMDIVSSIKIELQNGTIPDYVLYNDPAILYRNVHKQTFFVPLLLLNILLVILPIFILCLYPTKMWKRLAHKVLPTRMTNAINLFMDCFQGHYKNGTTGTYDYRFVSCFGFALRLIAGYSMASHWSRGESNVNFKMTSLGFILIATSMFYAHVRLCKKQYMNVTESLLYCTAGLLLLAMIRAHKFPHPYHSNLILAAILAPSIVLMGVMLYRVSNVFGITNRVKRAVLKLKRALLKRKAGEVDEPEPHRLTHPTQYTPLIK